MIVQPSGDGENGFNTPAADDVTLKKELHRDMIIRDRSHPSVLAWSLGNELAFQETEAGAVGGGFARWRWALATRPL